MTDKQRKPGFYWVRLKGSRRCAPGEWRHLNYGTYWEILGYGDVNFRDGRVVVLSDRIPPPTKRRASAKR